MNFNLFFSLITLATDSLLFIIVRIIFTFTLSIFLRMQNFDNVWLLVTIITIVMFIIIFFSEKAKEVLAFVLVFCFFTTQQDLSYSMEGESGGSKGGFFERNPPKSTTTQNNSFDWFLEGKTSPNTPSNPNTSSNRTLDGIPQEKADGSQSKWTFKRKNGVGSQVVASRDDEIGSQTIKNEFDSLSPTTENEYRNPKQKFTRSPTLARIPNFRPIERSDFDPADSSLEKISEITTSGCAQFSYVVRKDLNPDMYFIRDKENDIVVGTYQVVKSGKILANSSTVRLFQNAAESVFIDRLPNPLVRTAAKFGQVIKDFHDALNLNPEPNKGYKQDRPDAVANTQASQIIITLYTDPLYALEQDSTFGVASKKLCSELRYNLEISSTEGHALTHKKFYEIETRSQMLAWKQNQLGASEARNSKAEALIQQAAHNVRTNTEYQALQQENARLRLKYNHFKFKESNDRLLLRAENERLKERLRSLLESDKSSKSSQMVVYKR